MKIPLFGQTGAERYDDVSYQKTQNWYPHITNESKSRMLLYPTPALASSVSNLGVPTTTIRGMIEFGDKLYVVSGGNFYRIESTGTKVLLGTLNTLSGRVSMSHNGALNGKQILIVDGTNGYIYDLTLGTVVIIVDGDFPQTATFCAFIDSFFVVNNPAKSGEFFQSAGYDGTDWDALLFATAERSPDELQSLLVSNRYLYLIGTHTAEIWYNTGVGDFPFAPVQGGFMQWGTIAPHSVAEVAGTVLWLSQNDEGVGQVVMSSGSAPQIVSTVAIATEISKLTTLTDAYSWVYQYQQHTFYVLTFPTDGKTFVYDLATQMWHEWSVTSTGYHRGSHHVYVYGKHYIGDNAGNSIYTLDWDAHTDNGEAITRIRRSAGVYGDDGDIALRHHAVHIDIKEGVGNAAVTTPRLKLRWRDNNGAWSSYYSRSMGKIGETDIKCVWRRLGRSRERVYEISTSDACDVVLIDAYAILDGDNKEIS